MGWRDIGDTTIWDSNECILEQGPFICSTGEKKPELFDSFVVCWGQWDMLKHVLYFFTLAQEGEIRYWEGFDPRCFQPSWQQTLRP